MSTNTKHEQLGAFGWSVIGLAWGSLCLGVLRVLPDAMAGFLFVTAILLLAGMLVWTWRPRTWHERTILGVFVVLTTTLWLFGLAAILKDAG
jgi:hypothetical protein